MKSYTMVLVLCVVVCVVLPTTKSASKQSPARHSGRFSYLAGRPGIPGIPGLHGKPGVPGRDGREGKQGKRGTRGFQGSPGTKGSPGSPGRTGQPGPRGPQGTKGEVGQRGKPGPRSLSAYSNWKECSWKKINDGRDNGLIKDCVFYKKHSHTILHVYWNGVFRIYGCNSCCKRWFFTFNSAECKSPGAIDGALYMAAGKNQDIHRVRHIEGHCDKIHKGHVRVGFNVGNCPGYGNANAYTGWMTTSRLFIQEVPRPQP